MNQGNLLSVSTLPQIPFVLELVEKMVIGPLIIATLAEGSVGASKKLHGKCSQFLAGKLIIFLLSINRKSSGVKKKQTSKQKP